jgi:hypothetical protein
MIAPRTLFRRYAISFSLSGCIGLASTLAILYALHAAYALRWVSDDAFISFRYARNLVRGLGLVFNEGERVEGYTNFLWTLMIAGGIKIGLDPLSLSMALGIASFAVLLYYLHLFSRAQHPGQGAPGIIPTAMLAFALQRHAQIFATSGLETMLFACLILAGTYYLYTARELSRTALGFLLLVLSAMTRPEGLLIYGLTGLACLRYGPARLATSHPLHGLLRTALVHAPLIFLYAPYWFWRFTYYGWPFPNTYYAKSAGASHLEAGVAYLTLYLNAYYALWLLPALLAIFLVQRRRGRVSPDPTEGKRFFLAAFPALALAAYYVKAGGDFMFARFFIPLTPFALLAIERLITQLFWRKFATQVAIAFGLMCAVVFWRDPFAEKETPFVGTVSDEHQLYDLEYVRHLGGIVSQWSSAFRDANVRAAIGGTQAMIAYYSDAPFVIEAAGGLTDEFLAHQPLATRGKMGHEKSASLEYLHARGVHLHLAGAHLPGRTAYNTLSVKGSLAEARILRYEAGTMRELARSGRFTFIRFEDALDEYLRKIDRVDRIKLAQDYAEFRQYYFLHNDDPERENLFRLRLGLPRLDS